MYPNDVEEVLRAHPKVSEVRVIGVPHPKGGEVLKASIILRPSDAAGKAEIFCFCSNGCRVISNPNP